MVELLKITRSSVVCLPDSLATFPALIHCSTSGGTCRLSAFVLFVLGSVLTFKLHRLQNRTGLRSSVVEL